MRFLLKSAFWLTAAFLVIRPGMDLSAMAETAKTQAISAGQAAIVRQIARTECDTLECAGGKALLAAAVTSALPAAAPMHQDLPAAEAAPVPRPRPAWRLG